eukprot:CAMPEP_0181097342 /NCGR_PEP_ID=MMETSP1071-20121207/11515_1 /TAXON_ID=35127 /ORGANISM="Thalassiosira sp., Strain NH16" /LENGTH=558 /DNA_ID=CAMNT_0023179811 /DNA_START=35 /DNA_END=1712 /DNA_ORIENTATION=+
MISLFAATLFMTHASIAFVSPGRIARRGSMLPIRKLSCSPLLEDSAHTVLSKRSRTSISPLGWAPDNLKLRASLEGEDPAEPVPPQSKRVMPKTTDLKELASQIDNKSRPGSLKKTTASKPARPKYSLGLGRNMPLSEYTTSVVQNEERTAVLNWHVPEQAKRNVPERPKKKPNKPKYDMGIGKHSPLLDPIQAEDDDAIRSRMRTTIRLLPKGDEESVKLTKAVWDEGHFNDAKSSTIVMGDGVLQQSPGTNAAPNDTEEQTITDYQQIDLSIPPSVYSLGTASSYQSVDLVWDLMRDEAQTEAAREPLLVSFLYSTILNHPTLESALSFHLANRLSSPAMLSTQIMSLIREALDSDPDFRRNLRADMLAVRSMQLLPDVFLYFKGFHALQTYRVSHYLWRSGRRVLAHYLQSQVSQHFQIDIHPNATLGSGIMLDHGTGIVVGETAHLGHNCSVLHHVTLGGSGKKGVDRHPKVGNGVLLGAGSSVLGNIQIGDGCQVGAGTLVIEDLPPRSVAVGVPAKIIGRFVDVTAQPSIGMNQLGSKEAAEDIVMFGMDGI